MLFKIQIRQAVLLVKKKNTKTGYQTKHILDPLPQTQQLIYE